MQGACIIIDLIIYCNNRPFDIRDINLVPTLEKDFLFISLAVEQALTDLIYIAHTFLNQRLFNLFRLVLPLSV